MLPGFTGRDGAEQLARLILAAWPDCIVTVDDDLIVDGDEAIARITITGYRRTRHARHGSRYRAAFCIAGAYHVRVCDGRIIEHAGVEDALSLMAQVQPAP